MSPRKGSTHPSIILMMRHDWHFVDKWILCASVLGRREVFGEIAG